MKKYLLLLLMAVCLSVHAQTDHFKFMGIPITGSGEEFGSKLETFGFEREGTLYTKEIDGQLLFVEFSEYEKTQKVNNVHMEVSFAFRESAEEAFMKYHDLFIQTYNDSDPSDPGDFNLEMADYDENGESLGKVMMGIDHQDGFYILEIDFIDWEW